MWRNPRYPEPERPEAPPETGRRLATFPRGHGAELRASLDEYQGHPFVSLRLWEKDRDGAWWPVKGKGISVRLHEAAGLAAALASVAPGAAPPGPATRRTGRSKVTTWSPPRGGPVPVAPGGAGFDEFAG